MFVTCRYEADNVGKVLRYFFESKMKIMETLNTFDSEPAQRLIPRDIFEASRLSQIGTLSDISALIPDPYDDGDASFRSRIQAVFDSIAETIVSSEYKEFEKEMRALLEKVKDQYFIFDIEGVVMNSHVDTNPLNPVKTVYYTHPWIHSIITTLLVHGNTVGFWTAASEVEYKKMKEAMNPELAELPTICQEGWGKIISAFQERAEKRMTDEQVIEVMHSVYPTANEETFRRGLEICTAEELSAFSRDPSGFLITRKYPQLVIPSTNGFFIDDNSTYITSAVSHGWPEDRAITCMYYPLKDDALAVAQAIQKGVR